ncbi:zinc ABC transporter substrate-binding protein [candidate division KSB1 bacterium]|nr:zinc ABC transporter substrate-binding protein [candidate division KSB1 bacterium]
MYNSTKIIIFAFVISLIACSKPPQTDKPQVVVSIPPLAEFLQQIGGDRIEVYTMVPAGASPHSYEPKPSQLKIVSQAAMYVKVGTPIEFEIAWLDKLLALNKNLQVVDASQGIARLDFSDEGEHESDDPDHHNHGDVDPHIWLSLRNAQQMVRNLCQGLSLMDPDGATEYASNCARYTHQLDSLDQHIKRSLADKLHREFLVYHPAWGYFARDYQLHELSIEQEGKAPTLRGLETVIKQAEQHHIHVILASPQFNPASADRLAQEIHGRVISISPMEEHYLENMKQMAQVLEATME